jgi:hypothetical protein
MSTEPDDDNYQDDSQEGSPHLKRKQPTSDEEYDDDEDRDKPNKKLKSSSMGKISNQIAFIFSPCFLLFSFPFVFLFTLCFPSLWFRFCISLVTLCPFVFFVLCPVDKGGGSSCHQCKSRRSLNALTFCTSALDRKNKKCRKKYCHQCLKKFYKENPPAVCLHLLLLLLTLAYFFFCVFSSQMLTGNALPVAKSVVVLLAGFVFFPCFDLSSFPPLYFFLFPSCLSG